MLFKGNFIAIFTWYLENKYLIMDNIIKKIEALIFVSGEPISIKKISSILNLDFSETKKYIKDLINKYKKLNLGFELVEINLSVQFVVKSEFDVVVDKLLDNDKKKLLSSSELEVLSIIAYKQPVTRKDIFSIRGIKSDRLIKNLLELSLIKENGYRDTIGLPTLYVTTDVFLMKFGLKSLNDLPNIESFENKIDNLFD
ncbi:MAG: SMC-Scp complex subunit ScpB [Clostridiales bacterium]|nr:MAG: SMC-Scp complex subunit ScpB [Clostridiales bacterium]